MVGVDSFEIPHLQRVMLLKPSNLNLTVAWVYVRDYQRIMQGCCRLRCLSRLRNVCRLTFGLHGLDVLLYAFTDALVLSRAFAEGRCCVAQTYEELGEVGSVGLLLGDGDGD